MKALSFSLIAALAILTWSCTTETKHKRIATLPVHIDVQHLGDCTLPVSFTPDDFNWPERSLSMTVYSPDTYDATEIAALQVGDTLVYEAQPMIVQTIAEANGAIDINGGLDEGGCTLAAGSDGTYVTRSWDLHTTYSKVGKAHATLAKDFIIVDCGMNPDDPNDTIRTDQQRYIESMKDERPDFFVLNTRVTIVGGQITEIRRIWIP